jgi:hypothetical protein
VHLKMEPLLLAEVLIDPVGIGSLGHLALDEEV